MDRVPSTVSPVSFHARSVDSALAARLRREIEGEVLFDPASRGRYSTDASIYQIDPVGVVVPKTEQDAEIALTIAVEEGVPVLARDAGRRWAPPSSSTTANSSTRSFPSTRKPQRPWCSPGSCSTA